MVPVTVFGCTRPAKNDHFRPELTDNLHDLAYDAVTVPFLDRFVCAFRVAEIESTSKVLLTAIDSTRREQFLLPDNSEKHSLLGPDDVLATFAPGERQISGSHPASQG